MGSLKKKKSKIIEESSCGTVLLSYRPSMWRAVQIIVYTRASYIPENVILVVIACHWFCPNNALSHCCCHQGVC